MYSFNHILASLNDEAERISDERLKEYIKDGSIFDRRLDDDWD